MPSLEDLTESEAHRLETCSHALCSTVEAEAEIFTAITLRKLLLAVKAGSPEICICAAVLLDDGRVVRGHRHSDCMHTAANMYYKGRITQEMQGFVTSRNRWVSREEGARLQNAAGIVSVLSGNPIQRTLFSEDLY